MYCTQCGFKIEDNSVFCPQCGYKLEQRTQQNPDFAQNIKNSYNGIMEKPKSRLLAGILAIVLGSVGAHWFYLGYTRKGVTHLLMYVFFLGWLSQILAIIHALKILTGRMDTDAKGIPLTD
ncbi:MAG: TM2 domain-containing protein [Oscillospiraceae bacterium]|nr:TM2 domain-containing protein [Oscillospiraceae bacterium]